MILDWAKYAERLDADSARNFARLIAALNIATLVLLVATSNDGVDAAGHLLGTDFISFWTVGRMLVDGANVYDAALHARIQAEYFSSGTGYAAFFYPPVALFICLPLGLLSYFPALGAWLLTTGAAFVAAVRLWCRRIGFDCPRWFWFAAFPPVLITITHGQTSFLSAALLGTGAILVRSRPELAGCLFGLAAFKPQFGVLVPVVLVLTGEWRAIVSAVATVGLVAFGSAVWSDWFALSSAAHEAMAQGVIGHAKMQSPFAALVLLGAGLPAAYVCQAIVSLAVVGGVIWASRGREYSPALASLTLAGAPLTTPFILDYDLLLLAFPLLWLAATGYRPWEKAVSAAAFMAGAFSRPLAMKFGIPIMPLLLIVLFVTVLRRITSEVSSPPCFSLRAS